MINIGKVRTDWKAILRYSGSILICIGVILLLPLLILLAYPSEAYLYYCFLIPSAVAFAIGFFLKALYKDYNLTIDNKRGGIIVSLSWLLAILFCAWPFILSGQLNFTQAVFEATSGWTTAGLSVVDVTKTTNLFLLWRSVMHFFGGVGLVAAVLIAAIGPAGTGLFNAEGHDRLSTSIKKSVRIILAIYTLYVVVGIILYMMVGMPWFDSINHSIAAVSTGGFSTKATSIGFYNSFPIELVTIVLMILGNINFAANFILLRGKFKKFFKLGEIRTFIIINAIAIPLIAIFGINHLYPDFWMAMRVSAFEFISAITTTGYSLASYAPWRPFAVFIMIAGMIIGGGIGSTAGGIKQYRIYALYKNLEYSIKKQLWPSKAIKEDILWTPQGRYYVDYSDVSNLTGYVYIYMIIYVVAVCIITAFGYSLSDAMFEIASALSTVGLSVGITAANAHPIVLWTETICMYLGRLEIIVVIVAFINIFKDGSKCIKFKFQRQI